MANESGTEIKALAQRVSTLREIMLRNKDQIAAALPRHLTADRMIRVVMTSLQMNPALLNCEPRSVIGAVMQASQLGLEPDGVLGHGYLIPFKNKCRFIPGYKGLVDLVRRSGAVKSVEVHAVYTGDEFEYEFGLNPKLKHIPSEGKKEASNLAFAYCIVQLKDGGYHFDVMQRWEIDAIRKRSRASDDGPWVTDFGEMAKKTVVRRTLKMVPMNPEHAKAVTMVERADAGMDPVDDDGEDGGSAPVAGVEKTSGLDLLSAMMEEGKPEPAAEEPKKRGRKPVEPVEETGVAAGTDGDDDFNPVDDEPAPKAPAAADDDNLFDDDPPPKKRGRR